MMSQCCGIYRRQISQSVSAGRLAITDHRAQGMPGLSRRDDLKRAGGRSSCAENGSGMERADTPPAASRQWQVAAGAGPGEAGELRREREKWLRPLSGVPSPPFLLLNACAARPNTPGVNNQGYWNARAASGTTRPVSRVVRSRRPKPGGMNTGDRRGNSVQNPPDSPAPLFWGAGRGGNYRSGFQYPPSPSRRRTIRAVAPQSTSPSMSKK